MKITEEIFGEDLPIFDSVIFLVFCDHQIRTVQISYICVLKVSQFTQSRELKQPYRYVPLKPVRKHRGAMMNSCSVFSLQNSQGITLSRTSFLINYPSCRPATFLKRLRLRRFPFFFLIF